MELFLLQFFSGLSKAMFLFLLAAGLSLIFGVTRVINLAHGSLYMVGAYALFSLSRVLPSTPFQFWIALLIAPVVVAALGGLIEVTLLRRVYRSEELYTVLLTVGLIFLIDGLVRLFWGVQHFNVPRPEALAGSIHVLGQAFPTYFLLTLTLAPAVGLGLWALFYKTRWGVLVRAAATNREMVSALGVDVPMLYTSTFVLGSWLAGLGGALAAPMVTLEPTMDAAAIIEALAVVVVGGLGSFAGSLLAAVLVSEMESFGILVFPAISLAIIFILMAIVLIVRPWGLLGRPER